MSYASAPALNLADAKHRQMEADAVVENILGSIIGSVRKELKDAADFKAGKRKQKPKAPTAAGYAKLLSADLAARGFAVQPIGAKSQ